MGLNFFFLKTFKSSQDLISSGREFHSWGEATEKDLNPGKGP